jgi:hypothetical protein
MLTPTIKTTLYTIEEKKEKTNSGITLYNIDVRKAGSGNINVFSDFTWRNSKTTSIEEVPWINLYEKQLTYGKWISNIAGILDQVTGSAKDADPYAKLYTTTNTDFTYTLPYLVKKDQSIRGDTTNKWERDGIVDIVSKLPYVGGIAKAAGETLFPGFGIEKIVTFGDTDPKSITIEFPLYNTLTVEDAIKNFDFVSLFGLQNLKIRTSFLTYIPPKIYTVESPGLGGIYMPAAYVSKYSVKPIGTVRQMTSGEYSTRANLNGTSGQGVLIPEAYRISITLTEMVPETANIMYGALGGDKIEVLNTVQTNYAPSIDTLNGINNAYDTLKNPAINFKNTIVPPTPKNP